MNSNENRIIVEVPRFGAMRGKLVRKYVKEDPIASKQVIKYEFIIKIIELVCKIL
jgi:hypothetical protein